MPQQAWIQNATLKENIVFGRSFESSNYTKVVRGCALQQDFDMLPAGDSTEIGEKVSDFICQFVLHKHLRINLDSIIKTSI